MNCWNDGHDACVICASLTNSAGRALSLLMPVPAMGGIADPAGSEGDH